MATIAHETLGLRVRLERVRRGLSQEDVARAADVGQHDVSRFERDFVVFKDRQSRILRTLGLSDE